MIEDAPIFRDALFRKRGKHGVYPVVPPEAVPRVGAVTDSHCHLHLCAAPEIEAARAEVWGVTRVVNVVDVAEDGWEAVARVEAALDAGHELACAWAPEAGVDPAGLRRPELGLIVGVHPHNAKLWNESYAAAVRDAFTDPRVVGLGEAGVDFYYDMSPRDVQVEVFRQQIRLARELGVPMCLHIRDGHDVALAVMEEEGFPEAGCVLHCFTANAATLEPWLAHGVYVGFDGPLTFGSGDAIRDAARTVPRDRLLIETDAPFMTPAPMRGVPCGPAHVIFNAAKLAEIRGDDLQELCAQLNENAARLYPRRI